MYKEKFKNIKNSSIDSFKEDVLNGLLHTPKSLPSKYFYDDKGNALFQKIMDLEEYYPTKEEKDIFNNYKKEIIAEMGQEPFLLVDLGAGDAEKTNILLRFLAQSNLDFTYMPIDISAEILEEVSLQIRKEFPEIKIKTIAAEYFEALKHLDAQNHVPKLVLFMGGNIGNFDRMEAIYFLKKMYQALNKGDKLLIGFDLRKDPRLIRNAYDDSKGVTAAFNLNLLERINSELGANFNLNQWSHYASYDPVIGVVQSYLISTQKQKVHIDALDMDFEFESYEPIHTEYAVKYNLNEISDMANATGFMQRQAFLSSRNYFVDVIWKKP